MRAAAKAARDSPPALSAKGIIDSNRTDLSFPGRFRIKQRKEFCLIQSSGRKLYSKNLLVIVRPGMRSNSRLGVTVSTKVDKRAVQRNKIKRRLKEIFRLHRSRLKSVFDIVVIARQNAGQCGYRDLKRQMLGSLHHSGFLLKSKSKIRRS